VSDLGVPDHPLGLCLLCGRYSDRHSVQCVKFEIRDFADQIGARLELEELFRQRYSDAGLLDLVRREFDRCRRGGRVDRDGFPSAFGTSLVLNFDHPNGNRCRFEFSRETLGYERDKEWEQARDRLRALCLKRVANGALVPIQAPSCVRDGVRDVVALLGAVPCPHRRTDRRYALPRPVTSCSDATTAMAAGETFCVDCGSPIER
jgi:hypothetical protein